MIRMAKYLELQIHRPTTGAADHLYDPISKDTITPVHISILPSLLSTPRYSLTKPASSHLASKHIDNLYEAHDLGTVFYRNNQVPIPYLSKLNNLAIDTDKYAVSYTHLTLPTKA